MIDTCISSFGKNYFFVIFFVANKSDFVLTKFCMSICKDVQFTEPFNLHDLELLSIDFSKVSMSEGSDPVMSIQHRL